MGSPMALWRLPTVLACAIEAALCLAPAEASAEQFRLVVTGSTFVDFEGDCGLVDQRGFEHRARIIGSVPQSYAITAEAVTCEIRKVDLSGRLTVRLEQDGVELARGSTKASLGEVEVRSAGPWGPARATVKVVPLISKHGLRPPQQSGLPSLNPPIVPPLRGQIVPPLR
ncbi:MAG TPA: hypothetical protein VED46_07430 [Alphaproteobacteria bacterium]|nr:hypothetical protein [Alphaproteobacteria bacterium]